MLFTNVLLIDNFIKRYQTSDFINKSMTARQFCNKAPIHFNRLSK